MKISLRIGGGGGFANAKSKYPPDALVDTIKQS